MTETGFANPFASDSQGALRRRRYSWHDDTLWRETAVNLDRLLEVPPAKSSVRRLLQQVTAWQFDYLDKAGTFHDYWPISAKSTEPLPRAVRVRFTLAHWGTMSQFYVISAKPSLAAEVAA